METMPYITHLLVCVCLSVWFGPYLCPWLGRRGGKQEGGKGAKGTAEGNGGSRGSSSRGSREVVLSGGRVACAVFP